MRALIAAGGGGTRLAETLPDIPKALAPVCGKPLIVRQIGALKKTGIEDIIITTGHLAQELESFLGDGSRFGVRLSYFRELEPLGSAGALAYLKNELEGDFLMLMCDVAFEIDLERMRRFHEEKGASATLFVHPNSHPYDSDLLVSDADGKVSAWLSKKEPRGFAYNNLVNAGLYILNGRLLKDLKTGERADLELDVIRPAIASGGVFAYRSTEYIKDAGTPQRLEAVNAEWLAGLPESRSLKNRQRCIFLDRDGTINTLRESISRAEEIELLPLAAEAIAKINTSGYLAIVVSNQPAVARGECSFAELERINARIETLLGEHGAYLDDIFCCPHHPASGFEGEVKELKTDCAYRKPATGLLDEAAAHGSIDLHRSWMIGDSTRDILTGINAHCRTALVETGEAGRDGLFDVRPDIRGENLLDVVESILNEDA